MVGRARLAADCGVAGYLQNGIWFGLTKLLQDRPESNAPPANLLDVAPLESIDQFVKAPLAFCSVVLVTTVDRPERQKANGPSEKSLPKLQRAVFHLRCAGLLYPLLAQSCRWIGPTVEETRPVAFFHVHNAAIANLKLA